MLKLSMEWYQRHTLEIGFKHINFTLLTSTSDILSHKEESNNINIVNIVDFLKNENSNLLDFVAIYE